MKCLSSAENNQICVEYKLCNYRSENYVSKKKIDYKGSVNSSDSLPIIDILFRQCHCARGACKSLIPSSRTQKVGFGYIIDFATVEILFALMSKSEWDVKWSSKAGMFPLKISKYLLIVGERVLSPIQSETFVLIRFKRVDFNSTWIDPPPIFVRLELYVIFSAQEM